MCTWENWILLQTVQGAACAWWVPRSSTLCTWENWILLQNVWVAVYMMSSCLKCIHGRTIFLCCKSNVLHVYQKEHAYIWNGKMGCLTSTIASFMHFATSLTRHSAIVIFWSFIIAASLWRCSALFHKGTFAHSFCAALQLSTHLLTSSWVQAVEKKTT